MSKEQLWLVAIVAGAVVVWGLHHVVDSALDGFAGRIATQASEQAR
jgi:hypothetical protein